MLSKQFKTRKALCQWIKENKPFLEDEIGIKFRQIEISDNLLIGTTKDFSYYKIIIMSDFDFGIENLKSIKNTLENNPEDGKYIGVVMLAESFPVDLWEYIKTLKKYVRLVLPLYLKADKDNKPTFGYPDLTHEIATKA